MTDGLESLGRVRRQGLALLAVAFVVGGLAGAAVDRVYVSSRAGISFRFEPGRREGVAERENSEIPDQITRLGLSEDQVKRIRAVLARHTPAVDSMMRTLREGLPRVEHLARQEMMCVLTPAQQQAWIDWRNHERFSSAETTDWLVLVRTGTCGTVDSLLHR